MRHVSRMVKQICGQFALLIVAARLFAVEPVAASPELKDARVSLPYAELKSLWQAAQRERAPEKRKPPVEATLLSARYQLVLKGDQASGLVEYEAQSFTDEWIVIPLLGAQTQIEEVEPADVQLIARDDHYALVTNRVGKQKAKVKFAARLIGTTDGSHFHLTTSAAAINTLSVSGIPEKQMLRVADATQLSSEKDKTSFRLPATEQLDFDVIPEKAVVPPTPSRWSLETQALVQFDDGKLNYATHLTANTDNGSGLSMDIDFPAGANVTKVTGADLANWQTTLLENKTRRMQARWQTRDIQRRELEVEYSYSQPLTGSDWILKSARLIEGETSPPLFVIVAEQGLELTAPDQAPGPRRLPQWLLGLVDGKDYLIAIGDTSLTAKWLPLVGTAEAIIESSIAKMRIVADGAALTEIEYKIRHEHAVTWKVDLPEGSELVAATVDGRPASPIDRGERVVEFSLPTGKEISAVAFSYTAKKPAFKPLSGQIVVELPQTDLLVHAMDWELRIPIAYEITAFEGNVESMPSSATDNISRVISLRKELCKRERPHAEIFYQKPQPNK